MCSLVSSFLDRAAPKPESASSQRRTDSGISAVLRAFFRKRLQDTAGRSGRVRLLVRRTLARLARRRTAASPGDAPRLQKDEVLRVALMELHQLDVSAAPRPADRGPIVHRN